MSVLKMLTKTVDDPGFLNKIIDYQDEVKKKFKEVY